MKLFDVIVIGGGPAGVSAAVYAVRGGLSVALLHTRQGALEKAHAVENYYGFPKPVSGLELINNGLKQAERLGVKIIEAEVVGLSDKSEGHLPAGLMFDVETNSEAYQARVVVAATGASRKKPAWEGFDFFEGKGISFCAVCDAFFFRGKKVAVAGAGAYALHETRALLPIVESVTLLTDGQELSAEFPPEVRIVKTRVAALEGGGLLERVRFKSENKSEEPALAVSGLFVAVGTAGSTDLAKKIGAELTGGNIAVDSFMRTNIPGLLAAGDCTGGMKQIAKAVYEGAAAGSEAIKILRG